jgi:2-polyprenyl-6-methoxyphenol hydroxylase-like FAD-dependent oxidoreductase
MLRYGATKPLIEEVVMGYDAVIVGARLAGSSTAMLLARAGLRVLVLDQARFPSDTLSTHQLQVPGVARLARWGLLERVLATGAPPTRRVRFDNSGAVLDGAVPSVDGVDAMVSPRRTVLDAVLLDAAREAGAEVREATTLEELVRDGDRVTGVRCRSKESAGSGVEQAEIVVGADARHSTVARLISAPEYRVRPARSLAFYTYWAGLPTDGGEIYSAGGRAASAWPTNDDLVMTYVAWPAAEFDTFRRDPEANLLATLDGAGTLGARARAAKRVAPVRGTSDLPNMFRRPHGAGWALVGDAGLVMDPITGLGMGHALRDAELASAAIVAALGGARMSKTLAGYAKQRDRETKPIYDLTVGIASLKPPTPVERQMFAAIGSNPDDTSAFLSVMSGAAPVRSFFSPPNLIRLVGARGFLSLARSRPR